MRRATHWLRGGEMSRPPSLRTPGMRDLRGQGPSNSRMLAVSMIVRAIRLEIGPIPLWIMESGGCGRWNVRNGTSQALRMIDIAAPKTHDTNIRTHDKNIRTHDTNIRRRTTRACG
jgi:hypothetical protein